jgi:hypothetical protein
VPEEWVGDASVSNFGIRPGVNASQFADSDTNFADAGFGQILSASVSPGSIPFALRLNFR